MPRYALSITSPDLEQLYLAASYEQTGGGIRITNIPEDACSYVSFEQAAAVARSLKSSFENAPRIVEVNY